MEKGFEAGLPIVNDQQRASYTLTEEMWNSLPPDKKGHVTVNGSCRVRVILFDENDYQQIFINDLPERPIIEK